MEWDVSPILVRLGPLTIRWYGLLFALGFILAYEVVRKGYRDENLPEKDVMSLLTAMVVGTLVGARLGHCVFYDPAYYFSQPLRILKIWEGGLASHGGAMGILTALYLYRRFRFQKRSYL